MKWLQSTEAPGGGLWPRFIGLALTLTLAPTLLASCGTTSHTSSTVAARAATPSSTTMSTNAPEEQPFEKGIAFPRWGANVYGPNDATWAPDVAAMQRQTHAQWVEIIVSFTQNGASATSVSADASAPTPDDIYVGVLNAHDAGVKVYLKPLLAAQNTTANWNGNITFSTHAAAQQWFQSYWAAYEPYVKMAASAGVNQVSLGAEFSKLQNEYPDQWEWLIQQVSGVFHGPLTYELNHDTITGPEPSWLRDPRLTYVGVSMYMSLQSTPQDISASQIEQLWRQLVLPRLNQLSKTLGKPVILSEIGYRDTADCLHDPWVHTSVAPADPELQGAAYTAALTVTMGDPHVAGTFFWAWQDGIFSPGAPAVQALNTAYSG